MTTISIVRPDCFFDAQQQNRLAQLMSYWRYSRDRGTHFPEDQQVELEQLIDAELEASTRRAEALLREM